MAKITKSTKNSNTKVSKEKVVKKGSKEKVVKKTKKAKKEVVELKPIKEAFTKSELINYLAEETEMEPKAVKKVMASLEETVLRSLHHKGVGEFTIPGLVKLITRKVPARKAGALVRNPATGEMMKGKAKPASVRVKARTLSKVKKAALPA
jgi:nucleoid DNA-binding protein